SDVSSAGHYFSPRSFGHTGFTGTSIWVDPERGVFVILLMNRVNPHGLATRHAQLRRDVADAVQSALRAAPLLDWQARRPAAAPLHPVQRPDPAAEARQRQHAVGVVQREPDRERLVALAPFEPPILAPVRYAPRRRERRTRRRRVVQAKRHEPGAAVRADRD